METAQKPKNQKVPEYRDERDVDQEQVPVVEDRGHLAALVAEDEPDQPEGQNGDQARHNPLRQPRPEGDRVDPHHSHQKDSRVPAQTPQRGEVSRPEISLSFKEGVHPEPDDERDGAEHEERHPPRALRPEDAGSQPDQGRREEERQREPDREPGYDDPHPEATFLGGRLLGDDAAVVGVERALSEARDHTQRHEADQRGHDPAEDGGYPGPHHAYHDHGAVPEPVPQVAARELRQHVAREEQAAYEPAQRKRALDPLHEGDVVIDHVRDDRSRHSPVGVADCPPQEQPHPQGTVPVGRPATRARSCHVSAPHLAGDR